MMRTFSAALLCAILGMPGMAAQDEQEPFIPITDEMLLNPDPKDWLMHYRTFDFSGYSPLDQINGSNVDRLQLAWMRAMDAGGQEIRPLVYEGIMYVAHAGSDHIQAWDATTEKFVIRDIDVNTGEVYINMNMVARKLGDTFTICGHNVKSWWSWSYSPRTNLLYIPFNHACLSQTANLGRADGVDPRFTIPEPGRPADAPAGEMRAIDMATGKEVWRYEERSPHVGSALATGGDLVFFGDLNRRFRAFDAETGEVLWETIVGSQISGYPITYSVGGRQYVALPVGGIGRGRLKAYAPELEAPLGSNMTVVFTLPK